MRETITKNSIFFFAFVFSFVLMTNETKAQTGNLPTPAQLNAKLARIDSLNSFNAAHQELYSIQEIDKKQSSGNSNLSNEIKSSNQNTVWQNKDNIPTKTHTGPAPLMVTGAEQNCASGIAVCSQTYTQASSYTGHGSIQEVPSSTCLATQETNSIWYIFTVQNSGPGPFTFGFTLNTLKDYDFALYDLTAIGGCANVPTSTPIRCNFSATYGTTGMNAAAAATELPANSINAGGVPISPGISNITPGNTYALIIDNFSADANGYTLTFTGTADIHDVTKPTILSAVYNCNNTVTLTMSEPITCGTVISQPTNIPNSVATDFSDFSITAGPAAMSIIGETGIGCNASTNTTNQILLTLNGSATSGTYTITSKNGTLDGNTLIDKCQNSLNVGASVTFNYLAPISLSGSPTSICATGGAVTLSASGAPVSTSNIYTLSPGGTLASSNGSGNASFTVNPVSTTNYIVSVTYGGCTKTGSQTVTVNPIPVVTINPSNPILCSGTTTLQANVAPCSSCTYSWSGGLGTGQTTNAAVGAGTYTVTGTNNGCSSTATSTVSLASAPSASGCNVYYVTTTGVGDGSSALTPASIATLTGTILPAVACSGALIKMAVGVYPTITSNTALSIGGNITIEGGFKSDFTMKYSMDGTATYTTILRRDNSNANGTHQIIAFNVAAGSSNFRLQDLRIEMPGSASVTANPASSQQSNYGVYLGAGCSSYNIVRCYIDAGVGAN